MVACLPGGRGGGWRLLGCEMVELMARWLSL